MRVALPDGSAGRQRTDTARMARTARTVTGPPLPLRRDPTGSRPSVPSRGRPKGPAGISAGEAFRRDPECPCGGRATDQHGWQARTLDEERQHPGRRRPSQVNQSSLPPPSHKPQRGQQPLQPGPLTPPRAR